MTDVVMVPVPVERLTEVYALLGKETGERRRDQTDAGRSVWSGPEWSDKDLSEALAGATRAMGIVLPYLAERPGERVSARELAEVVYGEGASPNQLGGALGSFTRKIKHYGQTSWPFLAVYDEEARSWSYVMDPDTAARIRRLLEPPQG